MMRVGSAVIIKVICRPSRGTRCSARSVAVPPTGAVMLDGQMLHARLAIANRWGLPSSPAPSPFETPPFIDQERRLASSTSIYLQRTVHLAPCLQLPSNGTDLTWPLGSCR